MIYPNKILVDKIRTWDYQYSYFIHQLKIDFAVDVGANLGQWGSRFRNLMPEAKIISFEPDQRCKKALIILKDSDNRWEVNFVGLGEENSTESLNLWDVEGGSTSFRKLTSFGENFTGWLNQSTIQSQISIRRLDSEISRDLMLDKSCLLKIDVQGFEMEVLRGCGDLLKNFKIIEIEMPLLEIYSGSQRAGEIITYLEKCGFSLVSIASERWAYPGAADCDGLFIRSDLYHEMKGLNKI